MKKLLPALLLATTAVLVAAPAFADATFSVGYDHAAEKIRGVKADIGVLGGAIGYKITPNFGVQAEAAVGVNDDKTLGLTVGVDHSVAGYVVGYLPLTDAFSVDGRVGFGQTKTSIKTSTKDYHETTATTNYGVGAQYMFSGPNGVRVDYTKHDGSRFTSNEWAVSYVRTF